MRWDGVQVNRNKNILFRQGNPESDKSLSGNPIQSNYVAFVYRSKCKLDAEGYPIVDDAPAIPVDYSGTHYGYGKRRMSHKGGYIDGKWQPFYWTTPYYVAYDGKVYTGTIRTGLPNSYYNTWGRKDYTPLKKLIPLIDTPEFTVRFYINANDTVSFVVTVTYHGKQRSVLSSWVTLTSLQKLHTELEGLIYTIEFNSRRTAEIKEYLKQCLQEAVE